MLKKLIREQNSEEQIKLRRALLTMELLFQGKWQLQILYAMRNGPVRIGHLGRVIPGASKKVLSQSLRKLEANGIVIRNDMSEIVLHVEYVLRPDLRDAVISLLDSLSEWGRTFYTLEGTSRQRAQ